MTDLTPITAVAAALGKPDLCPVCGCDWRRRVCRHRDQYLEDQHPVNQIRIDRRLRGREPTRP